MYCPFCNAPNTKVVDSRLSTETNKIRRRRECEGCEKRFTTYEIIEASFPMIIKNNASREAFDSQKLRKGINRAIEKRPVSAEQVDKMVNEIEARLRSIPEKEIASSVVGEFLMESLEKVDQVAYVRFASVYRSFQDISAFQEEIEKLQKSLESANRK